MRWHEIWHIFGVHIGLSVGAHSHVGWEGTRCQAGAICTGQVLNASWYDAHICTPCGPPSMQSVEASAACLCAWHEEGVFLSRSGQQLQRDEPLPKESLAPSANLSGTEPGFWKLLPRVWPEPAPPIGWLPVDPMLQHTYKPRRTSEEMADTLAGRRVVFVGDSMVRQIFTRVICAMRQSSICVEPLSECEIQLYRFQRSARVGVHEATYAVDRYLFDTGAHLGPNGSLIADARGWKTAVADDNVLHAGGFELVFVWTRVAVVASLVNIIRALRPTVVVAGLFYWKPSCRETAGQASHVCPACRTMCAKLAWDNEDALRTHATLIHKTIAEPKSRVKLVVWLTSPPRPFDEIHPGSRFAEGITYYKQRNLRMRVWMETMGHIAQSRSISTEFVTLDYAEMASRDNSATARQVLVRNLEDLTHFQCSWISRPPKPITTRFKSPMPPGSGHIENFCNDAFNYAVVQRLIAHIHMRSYRRVAKN